MEIRQITSGTYQEHKLTLDLLNQTEWIPVSERLPKAGEYVGNVAKYYLAMNIVTYSLQDILIVGIGSRYISLSPALMK